MDRFNGNDTMITPTTGMFNIETEGGAVVESTGKDTWVKIIPVLAIILVVFLLVRKK